MKKQILLTISIAAVNASQVPPDNNTPCPDFNGTGVKVFSSCPTNSTHIRVIDIDPFNQKAGTYDVRMDSP
jgi:hypothetical protein